MSEITTNVIGEGEHRAFIYTNLDSKRSFTAPAFGEDSAAMQKRARANAVAALRKRREGEVLDYETSMPLRQRLAASAKTNYQASEQGRTDMSAKIQLPRAAVEQMTDTARKRKLLAELDRKDREHDRAEQKRIQSEQSTSIEKLLAIVNEPKFPTDEVERSKAIVERSEQWAREDELSRVAKERYEAAFAAKQPAETVAELRSAWIRSLVGKPSELVPETSPAREGGDDAASE